MLQSHHLQLSVILEESLLVFLIGLFDLVCFVKCIVSPNPEFVKQSFYLNHLLQIQLFIPLAHIHIHPLPKCLVIRVYKFRI